MQRRIRILAPIETTAPAYGQLAKAVAAKSAQDSAKMRTVEQDVRAAGRRRIHLYRNLPAHGVASWYPATAVWAVLIILYSAKWIWARAQALAEFHHPVLCCSSVSFRYRRRSLQLRSAPMHCTRRSLSQRPVLLDSWSSASTAQVN